MGEVDEAEVILALLKEIKVMSEPKRSKPIREKSVGHPSYPSIMPDLTGLA